MAKSQSKEHLRREGGVRGEILFFVVSDTEFYALSCGVIQISLFGLLFPTKAIFLRGVIFSAFCLFLRREDH